MDPPRQDPNPDGPPLVKTQVLMDPPPRQDPGPDRPPRQDPGLDGPPSSGPKS